MDELKNKIKVILIDYADIYCQKGGCKDCRREMNKTISKIKLLLHQRDNEIREKIQGMKYSNEGVHLYTQYNQALDDLLTYLSNREEEV